MSASICALPARIKAIIVSMATTGNTLINTFNGFRNNATVNIPIANTYRNCLAIFPRVNIVKDLCPKITGFLQE